ncbi:MAG: Proline--tRNA ligase [Candidatus Omnitrophica bacterium]|nr:Proline--tRNA ligase [Candidatus Omnitrophota bacterium]
MRWSRTLVPTLKENPQEALIKSHRLMIRSGLIRKLASGTYSYLPLGLRALHKAAAIVREEMDRSGALEVLLPALHPADLWRESGRYAILGEDMFHFKDRHGKENVLGPTHEEIITDLVRREVRSYRQLPQLLYQVQTKFRDEMRPRSGVIRSREFIMKDAYSFHATPDCLDRTYETMKETYCRIFDRCGLDYFVVKADPGAMGGSGSQEFVLFSDAGEDRMVKFAGTDTVMSVEMAPRQLEGLALSRSSAPEVRYRKVHTPHHSSVEGVAQFLKKRPQDLVKTMIFEVPQEGGASRLVGVLVRGDHEVSEYKIKQCEPGAHLAGREAIAGLGTAFGFTGPIALKPCRLYVDEDVLRLKDFVTGANEPDQHLVDVNVGDVAGAGHDIVVGDFRQAVEGDRGLIDGKAVDLEFRTAIELGHIFKLNLRYSVPLKAHFLDAQHQEHPMIMGCYGIGVNRILAAAIEQHADDKGIVWPRAISPYQLTVLMLDPKDELSQRLAGELESSPKLAAAGIDVLVDDREETAGVKFNDADLLGLPLRVVLGPKNLKNGKAEIKARRTGETRLVDLTALESAVLEILPTLR